MLKIYFLFVNNDDTAVNRHQLKHCLLLKGTKSETRMTASVFLLLLLFVVVSFSVFLLLLFFVFIFRFFVCLLSFSPLRFVVVFSFFLVIPPPPPPPPFFSFFFLVLLLKVRKTRGTFTAVKFLTRRVLPGLAAIQDAVVVFRS